MRKGKKIEKKLQARQAGFKEGNGRKKPGSQNLKRQR